VADQVDAGQFGLGADGTGSDTADPVLDPPWVAIMVIRDAAVTGDEVVGVSATDSVTGFGALTAVGLASRWGCGVRMLGGEEPIREVKSPVALELARELAKAVGVAIDIESHPTPLAKVVGPESGVRAVVCGLTEVAGTVSRFAGTEKVSRHGLESGDAGLALRLLEDAAPDVVLVLDGLQLDSEVRGAGPALARTAAVFLGAAVILGAGASAAAATEVSSSGAASAGAVATPVASAAVTPAAPSSPLTSAPAVSSSVASGSDWSGSAVAKPGGFWFDGVIQMDDPKLDAYPIAWTNPTDPQTSIVGMPDFQTPPSNPDTPVSVPPKPPVVSPGPVAPDVVAPVTAGPVVDVPAAAAVVQTKDPVAQASSAEQASPTVVDPVAQASSAEQASPTVVDPVAAPAQTVEPAIVAVADVPAVDVGAADVPVADVPAVDVGAADVPAVDVGAADVPAVDVPVSVAQDVQDSPAATVVEQQATSAPVAGEGEAQSAPESLALTGGAGTTAAVGAVGAGLLAAGAGLIAATRKRDGDDPDDADPEPQTT
ncbi:MAG: hypothetical protein ACH36H_11420, partial [Candidatus Nanopelagicales bacterium]